MKAWCALLLFFGLGGLSSLEADTRPRDPLPLAGLWALDLGTDISFSRSDDIQAYYAPGSLSVPESQVNPGIFVSLRHHFLDQFYAGLGLSTLPKGYTLQINGAGDTESYTWDALYVYALGGWVWHRGVNSYVYFQAETGPAFLYQAVYTRSGTSPLKGSFEGGTIATAASLGGTWFIIPSVGLNLEAGYRRALISPVEFRTGSGVVAPAYVKDFYVNGTGAYARAGLTFFWGVKNPWGEFADPPDPPATSPPPQ